MRRYSYAALAACAGLSENQLALHVRMSGTTLADVRRNGLTELAADRYAIRAGLHPAEVWPDWLQDDVA